MGDKINATTVGELFLVMGGCVAVYMFVKSLVAPLVRKWFKIEDDSNRIKGLPGLIATQQRQIDEINQRLKRGNTRFDTIEKDVSDIKTELASNNTLLKSMDMKLEILVSAQMGTHQPMEDIELLDKAYRDKRLEQLKGR